MFLGRVQKVCHADVVIQILNIIRFKPEDTIVEQGISDSFLELVTDVGEDALLDVTLLQASNHFENRCLVDVFLLLDRGRDPGQHLLLGVIVFQAIDLARLAGRKIISHLLLLGEVKGAHEEDVRPLVLKGHVVDL